MARLLIVGAGAAGLMAAGAALEAGHAVTLVEHAAAPAQKLLLTGKGRCNLTNDCPPQEFLAHVCTNPRFLYSALNAFAPADTMALFQRLGVPLKVERGRRVFPVSDDARQVREALLRFAAGAQMVAAGAVGVCTREGRACGVRLADGRTLAAECVLLATGGASCPATGSTGDGYAMAQALGHTVLPPVPSLVGLTAAGDECRRMAGLSLRNVRLSLWHEAAKGAAPTCLFCEQGELLFTHTGISGPLVLSASACLAREMSGRYTACIDWKPALSDEALDARLLRDFSAAGARSCAHALDKLLPRSAIPVFLQRWGVSPSAPIATLTRAQRQALAGLLRRFPLSIAGRGELRYAVVTRGGVDVREVDPRTMQSRLVPGLYFAGEVLDVDALTGGYNLQIAFSTAMAAVRAL